MPRRKYSYRKRSRSTVSSVLGGYIVLAILAIALFKFLLPFIILVGLVWGILKVWQSWKQQQEMQQSASLEKQEKLNSVLYQLIQHHDGRVSVLDFALTAKVPAEEAKEFLDAKAKEFIANFEATDSGDVLYVFNSLSIKSQPSQPLQISPPDFSVFSKDATSPIDWSASLSQADLARRLALSSSSVGRKKFAPDFAQWTRQRDPDNLAWFYDNDRKRFYPLKDA